MDVKALFFDIDGTILTSKGIMNSCVYDALLECKQKGYIISIVTARSGRIVFRDYEIVGDKTQLLDRGIFYNGGTIFDKTHKFYQHLPIPGNVVNDLIGFTQVYDDRLQIALQHDDIYHAFKYSMPEDELELWGFNRKEILDFDDARHLPTTKMMVFTGVTWRGDKSEVTELYLKLKEDFGDSVNLILADSKKCIYISSKYATKGNAIQQLISLYGIKPEEVAVFGDDTPDIGMFGIFGHSIAMGNAHDSLKAKSSFVTLTNDQDGVVHALRTHLHIL